MSYNASHICDMCKECIKRQIKTKGSFKIECIPVPKEMYEKEPHYPIEKVIGQETYATLTEDVKLDLQIQNNKILWAKEFLGWTSYNSERNFEQFYQSDFLKCTAKNKVMRFGRRLGKCVEENTLIATLNRGLVQAKRLLPTDILLTYNSGDKSVYPTRRWAITENGMQECLKITTESGKFDIVTKNHPYLVGNKWILAEELKKGDKLTTTVFNNKIKQKNTKPDNYALYKEIGIYAGVKERMSNFLFRLSIHNTDFLLSGILRKDFFQSEIFVQQVGFLLQKTGRKYSIHQNEKGFYFELKDRYEYKTELGKEKITNIESVGVKKTFSISVQGTHTFITNNFVTHNTEAMTIDILHYALNNSNKKIMVIAPFLNLIEEIFDRLEKLLSGEKSAYRNEYSRKKSPSQKITLKNGSVINGFTTATDGASIRGQSADRLYIDEAAYIPLAAFAVIMAFKLDKPQVNFIASSTPSALETNFRKWCLEDSQWREFHQSSEIIPNFEDGMEAELKNTLTEEQYNLEVKAEFVEGSSKVFKSGDILSASEEYKYINFRDELEEPNKWKIAIGVDYNEFKNGSQICVLGLKLGPLKENERPLKILNFISINKNSDGSVIKDLQLNTVETIINLQQQFEADFVYCDEGHGSTQNEILSKHFFNIGKVDIFKSVNFSKTYSMEDIFTNTVTNKRIKVMMINFLQKRFEKEEIIISSLEESSKANLLEQLREYFIEKYDNKEQPVFKGLDHKLDALMLANFALVENLDSVFDRSTGNFIMPFKNLNYKALSGTSEKGLLNKDNKIEGMYSLPQIEEQLLVNRKKRNPRRRIKVNGFFDY